MTLSLEELPPELLAQLIVHCENAQTLLRIALTCKRLNHFIQTDGFRVFVQTRFPSFQTPPLWKDAAHSLTTWSRNWDRKAFIARYIEPFRPGQNVSNWNLSHQRRQTMGYQPVIDSYEEFGGGNWSSRKEVLAWGGGAELILRLKWTGDEAKRKRKGQRGRLRQGAIDHHHHVHEWITYHEKDMAEGRDDITATNLIRPHQRLDDGSEHVIVGRASGRLDRVAVAAQGPKHNIVARYITNGRPVRSATVNDSPAPLIAACLADSIVALYAAVSQGDSQRPLSEVSAIPPGRPGRTWSSRFLRQDRLAVGRGPSGQPLLVYGIREAGFSERPIWKYEVDARGGESTSEGRTSENDAPSTGSTSIYPIAPISPSSVAGGAEGDLFLSGGYDGNIRLHDSRSPASSAIFFMDPVDNSAIYSLLPFGQERFAAGASRHAMIKVFDLRMPGGRMYHASNLDACDTGSPLKSTGIEAYQPHRPCCNYHFQAKEIRSNYNMYLRTRSDSPVYSLSSPSPFSPTFYAGIEGAVAQFDVVSAMDPYPDTLFTNKWKTSEHKQPGVMAWWDPRLSAMNLRLYEQVMGKATMKTQKPLSPMLRYPNHRKGWDERWDS
ncbi:MAG: hypothetical protein Q9191_003912 [Dirinaria sp. TL-2023a]